MAPPNRRSPALATPGLAKDDLASAGSISSTYSPFPGEVQLDAVNAVAAACGGWLQPNKVRCPICGGKLSVAPPTRGRAPLLYCWGRGCAFDDLKIWLIAHGAWNGRYVAPVCTSHVEPKIDWRELIERSVPNHPRLIRYLRSRGLSGNYDPELRLLEAKDASELGLRRHHHMVAILVARGCVITGCQTTQLALGSPGRVKRPGAKLSHGRVRGSAVLLSGGNKSDREFIIGEGVETVASACELLGLSGCATLGAYNLRHFTELPLLLRNVVLLVDRDQNGVGERCAKELADKLKLDGYGVKLLPPPDNKKDWNDVVSQ